MLSTLLLPLLAAATMPESPPPPPPPESDRLNACLAQLRNDSEAAIVAADDWLDESKGAARAAPLQCLGAAFARLGDWAGAEENFLKAREATPPDASAQRARLAGMAGNAALADSRFTDALAALDLAREDATLSGERQLAGDIEVDRARALAGMGLMSQTRTALEKARMDAPGNADGWLLSATLARREGDLASAQKFIETAAGLRPVDREIGLEAGVIAVLSGNTDAARKSWQSVVDADPASREALTARGYLAQLTAP